MAHRSLSRHPSLDNDRERMEMVMQNLDLDSLGLVGLSKGEAESVNGGFWGKLFKAFKFAFKTYQQVQSARQQTGGTGGTANMG
jgi:hypothetical protein